MMRLALIAISLGLLIPAFCAAQRADSQSTPNKNDPSTGLSLDELGFTKDQTQGSEADQALLNKRSRMLKIHQELGLLNIAPMLATLYTAPGDKSHQAARNLHAILGLTTFSLFDATVYYAIKAPKPKGTKDKGSIRVHKVFAATATIGMVFTPILGAMAYDQGQRGEKVHGAASFHGAAAAITALSYGGDVLSVSIKF